MKSKEELLDELAKLERKLKFEQTKMTRLLSPDKIKTEIEKENSEYKKLVGEKKRLIKALAEEGASTHEIKRCLALPTSPVGMFSRKSSTESSSSASPSPTNGF